jgi:hypothetical protein
MQAYEEHPAHIAIGEKYGYIVENVSVINYWSKE